MTDRIQTIPPHQVSMLLGLYLGSSLMCQCSQVYNPLSLLWISVWLDLSWSLWSTCTWILCMAIHMDLFSFFYMLISSTICWICFLCCIWNFLLLCQKLGVRRYVVDIQVFDLVPLVLLSVFMTVSDCFQYCSSVVEFEVRDCDKFRNSFNVQDCLGYSGFAFFIWSWALFLQGLWRILLRFWWTLHWICRLRLVRLPFLLC